MSLTTPRRRLGIFTRSATSATVAGAALPAGWSKLPLGGGHALVGPGGVYYVTVARRSGSMRVSATTGASDPAVEQCRREAANLGRQLTLALGSPTLVHPVVAVEGAEVQVLEQPAGVTIVAASLLSRYLASQPTLMRESGVQQVRSALAA